MGTENMALEGLGTDVALLSRAVALASAAPEDVGWIVLEPTP